MAAAFVATAIPVWLSEEDLSCIICQELLDCATTLPCGHSFCLRCLQDTWVSQQAGVHGCPWACPLCREGPAAKPKLHKNTLLQDLVDKYRRAAQELEAGPEPAAPPGSPRRPPPAQVTVQKSTTEVIQELTKLVGQLIDVVNRLEIERSGLSSGVGKVSSSDEYNSYGSPKPVTSSASQWKIPEILHNLEEIQDKLQGIDICKEAPGEQIQESLQRQRIKEEKREAFNQEPRTPLYEGIEEWFPEIIKTPPQVFPGTEQQMSANSQSSQGYVQISGRPTEMIDVRRFKEAMAAYGMHSHYLRQILNDWSTQYKVTPQDWRDLMAAVLDGSPHCQWLKLRTIVAEDMERCNRFSGVSIRKDQLLGEGQYCDLRKQVQFNDATIEQCRVVALTAWDNVEEQKKRSILFEKILQGPTEAYAHFLERLTLIVNRIIANSYAGELLIKVLAFSNANRECQKVLRPLKDKDAPLEEWIKATADAEQALAKAQNMKCFNCGKLGHLRKDCRRRPVTLENNQNRRPQAPGVCRRCGKGRHWISECRSVRDVHGNVLLGNQR